MKNGIDVSSWQTEIDWNRVKHAGIDFAMIRSGYGRGGAEQVNNQFHNHVEGAQNAGIETGVYHYSYAVSPEDAVTEANFCLGIIKGYTFSYPIVFDIEDASIAKLSRREKTDICKAFCNRMEEAGYYAMIYCNPNWLENHLFKDELLPNYDLWLAEWGCSEPSYPCGMWQYTSSGKVEGIDGNVDKNISYRDYPTIIREAGLNREFNNASTQELPSSPSTKIYTVVSGDTLWGIADRFLGAGTRYQEIKDINGLDSDTIYPGQTIKIPSGGEPERKTYTVVSGDTLWGIADKFLGAGVRAQEIKDLNDLSSDTIYPGQILRIPD